MGDSLLPTPSVSVIIPTHNRSAHVEHAIKSVLQQTYRDFEILVIDDGSEDNTAEVVSAIHDPRIRYYYQENKGRSVARNRGFDLARGAYIALLDDDDLFFPHKLERQVTFFESHPDIDVWASPVPIIDEKGKALRITDSWTQPVEVSLVDLLLRSAVPTSSSIFTRRSLERMDRWFDSRLDYAETNDFFIRMLHSGSRMMWFPEIVSVMRRHTNRHGCVDFAPILAYVDILKRFLSRNDLPNEILRERNRLLANSHLTVACHAYALGITRLAQSYLQSALAMEHTFADGVVPLVFQVVAVHASHLPRGQDEEYVNDLFNHLPDSLSHLEEYRQATIEMLGMLRSREPTFQNYGEVLKGLLPGSEEAPITQDGVRS